MKFNFKKKEITDQTLSEILKKTREEKNISLEKVARIAKMNPEYLRALEQEDYQKLPQGIYGKSFLREYCYYLKLDYKKMLDLYEQEVFLNTEPSFKEDVFSHERINRKHLFSLPKIARNIILSVVIGACFVYLGFRVKAIIAPPELIITNPAPDQIMESTKLEVKGKTELEARVFINGQEVFSGADGNFSKEINLKYGINTIKILAQKKYGRDAEVVRQVLVK